MGFNEPIYSEKQRFRQWWIWLVVLIGPAILFWVIFQQIVMVSPSDNNSTNALVLIILGLPLGIGLPLFMYTTGLDTEVRDSGVFIRFRPFHLKWMVFEFDSIQKSDIHTYSPLKDYGGWGIRYGKMGKAYNVSGNTGVLLKLKDGKTILIGSKNHELLWSAINKRLQ